MTKARDIASAAPAPSTVSATELGYLDGVSSAIQTQLDGKQAANANVSTTELGYLDGVTSAIQTQIDGKSSTSHNHDSTYVAKSLVDAKGDLLVGSANDTVSRLAVASTAGYVLTVDSAETTGLKWAAGGTSFKGVLATNTVGQSISSGAETTLTFNGETYDTDSFHSTSTNTSRLTVPSSGYYFVWAKVRFQGNSSGYRYIYFRKNGTTSYQDIINYPANASDFSLYLGMALPASANDYFEVRATQNSGGNLEVRGDDNGQIAFGCYYLGA